MGPYGAHIDLMIQIMMDQVTKFMKLMMAHVTKFFFIQIGIDKSLQESVAIIFHSRHIYGEDHLSEI